ncbi:MAG: CpsD/CapB family tyrosine-protein kinase [Anaerolineae bacterium]|nr:CpsD/CapB family tyrosine-protein kinase [Anaerolineae bacterium]
MEKNLVAMSDPQSPAAEAYRALRINLQYATLDTSLKTLVFAAPAPEKGNPAFWEVAANLAIVMAQARQRVILVDANLRDPQLHEVFGVPNAGGLTQAILKLDEDGTLPLLGTNIPGLRLLTVGKAPPNPADILSSNKMDLLLERLTAQADIVILLAPPVTSVVDAAVLGTKVDGFLLIVRSGRTRRDRIEEAQEILASFDVNLLGAVLTDAPDGGLMAGN